MTFKFLGSRNFGSFHTYFNVHFRSVYIAAIQSHTFDRKNVCNDFWLWNLCPKQEQKFSHFDGKIFKIKSGQVKTLNHFEIQIRHMTRLSKFRDGMRQNFQSRLGIRDRKFLDPPLSPWSAKIHFKKFRQINYFYCLFYLLKRKFHRIYGKHYDKNENF